MEKAALIQAAAEALKGSYSPYSEFCVGAALLCRDGKVFTGANIENSSFSLTICAERSAFVAAVGAGEREFEAMAVVGGRRGVLSGFCPPCGACRQVMAEFCQPDFQILLFDGENEKSFTLGEMLPEAFGI